MVMSEPADFAGLVALTRHEAATLAAIMTRLWPADASGPDAVAIGALDYLDRALAGHERPALDLHRPGVQRLDRVAVARRGRPFRHLDPVDQEALLAGLERGELPGFSLPPQKVWFALLRRHLIEGLLADPAHGGNRGATGWRSIGYPGVHLAHDADEHAAETAATKGGRVRTLRDHELELDSDLGGQPEIIGFDPERGLAAPSTDCDVLVVGVGGVGGLVAPWLASAGLRVVALEAGHWRAVGEHKPDELSYGYYARAGFSTKFLAEAPRWREHLDARTVPMPFSLGRMSNGVGGSLVHYGARLRRHHPHQFQMRTTLREHGLLDLLEPDCTIADWPVSYADLEPHYAWLEEAVGVAGPEGHPFIPRSTALPMPPTRPPACGRLFAEAATRAGLHPTSIPIGQNTVPYAGRPAMTYSPWAEGLGSVTAERWLPMHDLLPQALATGRLDLRTGCRVLAVLVDADGTARGVRYVGPDGLEREQQARAVVLAAYTFETVRLMLVSACEAHPAGLGNDRGQLGRHFMTKQYPSVHGHFPDRVFNRHTGPGSQGIIVEDFLTPQRFAAAGMPGGGTIGTENQLLPIQLASEPLPPDVPAWGAAWKRHVRDWNHRAVLRIQADTLPYQSNCLDLDPLHRDRSGYGLPLIRVTYAVRNAERRLGGWLVEEAEALQRAMGAARTWRGPSFTGIGSCHDFGGCRMGTDPDSSVVSDQLEAHDTPGLYVMGGAVFPSCHGVNPTLTIWALARRATELLADRLNGASRKTG